jgi:methylenetetrahydrofolate dehydrogenase (NADP+)/methenyltetrahydrofolate cyclohydrolase
MLGSRPMTARLLDGKTLAQKVRTEVAAQVARFTQTHGRPPGLDVVLVGENPASVVYTRNTECAGGCTGWQLIQASKP